MVWYSNLFVTSKSKLSKTVIVGKPIGKPQKQLCNIFDCAVQRKAKHITANTTHPLHSRAWAAPVWLSIQGPKGQAEFIQEAFSSQCHIEHKNDCIRECLWVKIISLVWFIYVTYLLLLAHCTVVCCIFFVFMVRFAMCSICTLAELSLKPKINSH